MKRCTQCLAEKPLSEFRFIPSRDTHHSWCRLCENERSRERAGRKVSPTVIRNRALARLVDLHREDFEKLHQEELDWVEATT